MAFLNEKNDAEYSFYKDYPNLRLDVNMPEVTSDDIVMFGSFYAITPQFRDKVKELLDKARKAGAIIYYDVNFRSTHAHEAIKLMPTILENFEYADIVRGSTEDFGHMFGMTDADKFAPVSTITSRKSLQRNYNYTKRGCAFAHPLLVYVRKYNEIYSKNLSRKASIISGVTPIHSVR